MHPLVRKLYKEALFVGKDYPLGLDYVRREWKKAIRNPENCPSCYHYFDRQTNTKTSTNTNTNTNESKRGDNSDADGDADADATTTTTTREEKDANSSSSNNSSTSIRCAIPRAMHSDEHPNPDCERELRKAVGKGRYMIREMIGVIQLKKYRSLKQRYNNNNDREPQNYNYNYNHTAAAATATAAATNNHGAVVVRVQKPPSELDPHNEDETPVNPGLNRT